MNDSDEFNLTGLLEVFKESLKRDEATLAFQLTNGKGRFVFMLFFAEEDKGFENTLFIFCRNIKFMIKLKLYGNQYKGKFSVYINDFIKSKFIEELQLERIGKSLFDFEVFLNDLNSQIPKTLPLSHKISKVKEIWTDIDSKDRKNLVDDSDKIYLIGQKNLPSGKKPREKTLRKL